MKAYLSDDNATVVVFIEGEEEPEWYTTEEFVNMYGEDALPKKKTQEELDAESYAEYWDAAIELVNAWAKYQAKRKLFANYMNEETRHRVEHVVVKSYGNDPNRLKRHTRRLYLLVQEALEVFWYHCRIYGIEPISMMWLRMHLLEDKNYKSLREKCRRKMKASKQPISLYELI